jgi:hypothetical protein
MRGNITLIGGNMYKTKFLSWCESYEQEVQEMRELIEGSPADVKMLKREYQQLTGKRYRKIEEKETEEG